MRFHVVNLPHTQTTAEYVACAYTQKVVKFARMMHAMRGHTVFLYSGADNEASCTEHVPIVTKVQQAAWWGPHKPEQMFPIVWDESLPCWRLTNARAALEIGRRAKPGDFLCIIGGNCQRAITDALPDLKAVEFGIGYEGTFARYRCFESHAWRHYVHGKDKENDGRPFDVVIPNYFDPADFPFSAEKADYSLFLGRLIRRKGVQVAVETTRAIGSPLLLAGQA